MDKNYLKLVIVGHVDHGKSTLIGRLLVDTDSMPQSKIDEVKTVCESLGRPFEFAYLMDYLEEEREKKITIDTAQIFFKTASRDYVIIDAPGHKEFLKNMITGSAQAESAVLIVDANEGIKEQTKRHAYILSLLGLKQVVVVINKMDLVGYQELRFEEIKKDLLDHLTAVNITPKYIIPISASQGDNVASKSPRIAWYAGPTILEALDLFKPMIPSEHLPLRFPIQDVYNFDGQALLAGQIESGVISTGQEVVWLPSGLKTKVTAIIKWLPASPDASLASKRASQGGPASPDGSQGGPTLPNASLASKRASQGGPASPDASQGGPADQQDVKEASAGHNVCLTIADDLKLSRGQVACPIDRAPQPTNNFSAKMFWMSASGVKTGEKFVLKCATQEVTAQIAKIKRVLNSSSLETIADQTDEIKETEVAEVEITAEQPLVVEDYNFIPELGRFVIIKGEDIAAGGIVTIN